MKHFPLNSIKKIKKRSQQLDAESVLSNKSWYVFSDTGEKIVFMFRSNAELLIVVNGKVSKGGWILIPHNDLFIDMGTEFYLYNIALVENQLLILNLKESNDYLILIEDGFMNQLALNSIDRIDNYLENIYIIEAELEQRRIEKIRQETIRLEEEKKQEEQERIKIEKEFKIYVLKFRLSSFVLNIIYSLIASLILSVISILQVDIITAFFNMFLIFVPLTEVYVGDILVYKKEFDNFKDKSKPLYSMYFINLINRLLILVLVTYLKFKLNI